MSYYGRKMKEDLLLRGFSKKTISAYLREMKKLIEFYQKSPELISEYELRNYFIYLRDQKKISESLLSQALCGIKFFYTKTLNRRWNIFNILKHKKNKALPNILSKSEIRNIINVTKNLKHRAILAVIYSGGLRISEVCRLKVADIDSKRMIIKINNSKNNKDRYTILSNKTLKILKEYWQDYRPVDWLFPGFPATKEISTRSVVLVFQKACEIAGIKKKVSVHSLRHSFATHLMEDGTNLRVIQSLLGHYSIKSTVIYTHVCDYRKKNIVSPMDTI